MYHAPHIDRGEGHNVPCTQCSSSANESTLDGGDPMPPMIPIAFPGE